MKKILVGAAVVCLLLVSGVYAYTTLDSHFDKQHYFDEQEKEKEATAEKNRRDAATEECKRELGVTLPENTQESTGTFEERVQAANERFKAQEKREQEKAAEVESCASEKLR